MWGRVVIVQQVNEIRGMFTFSFGGTMFDDGVDVSNLCKISSSIVKRRRAGSGLVFPSLVLTIPVRTYSFFSFSYGMNVKSIAQCVLMHRQKAFTSRHFVCLFVVVKTHL